MPPNASESPKDPSKNGANWNPFQTCLLKLCRVGAQESVIFNKPPRELKAKVPLHQLK